MHTKIKVRFAPSPTGYLHVGGARTAIFNWLYARGTGGAFYLRIEDTDRERSTEEMSRAILDGLRWLGLDWDAAPVLQSDNLEKHRSECARLLAEGKAYSCYCLQEDLARKREEAERAGGGYKYDRACRDLSAEQRQAYEREGRTKVLRFRVPEGVTRFYDVVHGEVEVRNDEIDDFVILRSDESPIYNLAVVVDDNDLGISHVLRGDDHLSNTPKQILLYEALGYDIPQFGHLPMILGADKKRLSKRHGSTAVGEYEAKGYLPEALFNFLALLGWSPGDDREVLTRDELIEAFDVSRILKKSAVFDEEKLRWMNGEHIRRLTVGDLVTRLRVFDAAFLEPHPDSYLYQVAALMQERMELLGDFILKGYYFFSEPDVYEPQGVKKHWKPEIAPHFLSLVDALGSDSFTPQSIEELVRARAEQAGFSAGKLIHPLRLALTGGTASPSLFDMMAVLGKETCLRRLKRFMIATPPNAA